MNVSDEVNEALDKREQLELERRRWREAHPREAASEDFRRAEEALRKTQTPAQLARAARLAQLDAEIERLAERTREAHGRLQVARAAEYEDSLKHGATWVVSQREAQAVFEARLALENAEQEELRARVHRTMTA